MVSLLGTASGIDELIPRGKLLPGFDYYSPLLSVPGILRTDLSSIPADVPYLFADPNLVSLWQEKLREIRGFRIGISWSGRFGKGPWEQRNVPVHRFEALAQIPHVCFVSLQNAARPDELADLGKHIRVIDLGAEVDEAHGGFMDTAAVMKALDLVITCDTSIAHLAGALGVPVWVTLQFVPDWRWLLGRNDSPWYPTMRLFRQKQPGDWTGVFDEMEAALMEKVLGVEDGDNS